MLCDLKENEWFHPIMGNHDLMNLYNMGLGNKFGINEQTEKFNNEWLHYFNSYEENKFTPYQYNSKLSNDNIIKEFLGKNNRDDFVIYPTSIPEKHKNFLVSLPLYYKINNYIFVHAGLNDNDIDSQLDFLDKRNFQNIGFPYIPEQLKNKKIWNKEHNSNYIVVSGHCKLPNHKNFVSEKRITFHSGSCNDENLHCGLLPDYCDIIDTNKCIFFDVQTDIIE